MLDIETLLIAKKIRNIDTSSPREIKRKQYINEDEVYRTYINLIHELHSELWDGLFIYYQFIIFQTQLNGYEYF